MARNLVSLNAFVEDYMASTSEESFDKNFRKDQVRVAALRAFRDMQLDSFNRIYSARLPVNQSLYTVELPADYVRYTKIGILDENCNVISVSINPNMNIAGDILLDNDGAQLLDADGYPLKSEITDCGDGTPLNPNAYGYVFGNYNYNGFYGRLYGWGGGNNANGYYRFNDEENRIELSAGFSYENIILEYISDLSMAADPQFPIEAEKAMYSGTYHFLIQRMGQPMNATEKMNAERVYLRDKRFAKSRINQPTKDEIIKSIYRNFTLSPRITS